MKYKRTMPGPGFDYVSILDDAGNLITTPVWPDGFTLPETRTNIFDIGWSSLSEFLAGQKGFKPYVG